MGLRQEGSCAPGTGARPARSTSWASIPVIVRRAVSPWRSDLPRHEPRRIESRRGQPKAATTRASLDLPRVDSSCRSHFGLRRQPRAPLPCPASTLGQSVCCRLEACLDGLTMVLVLFLRDRGFLTVLPFDLPEPSAGSLHGTVSSRMLLHRHSKNFWAFLKSMSRRCSIASKERCRFSIARLTALS